MIKKVSIRNFRSFLEEEISDFSEQLNLVIGKNGQGKSNFYAGFFISHSLRTHP